MDGDDLKKRQRRFAKTALICLAPRTTFQGVSENRCRHGENEKTGRKYLLLTEFEGRTVSYGPSFFLLDLCPARFALGP